MDSRAITIQVSNHWIPEFGAGSSSSVIRSSLFLASEMLDSSIYNKYLPVHYDPPPTLVAPPPNSTTLTATQTATLILPGLSSIGSISPVAVPASRPTTLTTLTISPSPGVPTSRVDNHKRSQLSSSRTQAVFSNIMSSILSLSLYLRILRISHIVAQSFPHL